MTSAPASASIRSFGGQVSLWPLYLGFAAAGVGVALPGAVLPVLLARWHLQDQGGGSLFLLAWIGSSLGALVLSGSLFRALALGSGGVALGAVGLTLCPAALAAPCMLVYGLGLGTAMTASSLLLQRQATDSGRAMVRLNLLWAFGASMCPLLAIRTLHTADLRPLLYPLAIVFGLLTAWAGFQRTGILPPPAVASGLRVTNFIRFFRAVPLSLIVLVLLTTGVEASAGGWLATYAKRGGDPFAQIVAAPTCLWAGLLLSRLFWSFSPLALPLRWIIRGTILLMTGSACLLLITQHGWPFLLAAAGLGFGIGPAFPLLLARALRFHASGLIFFLAGFGSACLPWLMGFVSTHFGSLHAGFFVPAGATLVMLMLSLRAPLRTQDGNPL